ncbi:MAG: alkaline phosphatase family protein, partial [Desulfatiglandales bacterium]|nr:alkaline phosphatase family protein [Desulfatiglandales bacterium]
MDKNWHDNAYGKILESLDNKASLALSLYSREPWDCFMVLFGETDTVSHHFWKFHDTASPRFEAGKEYLSKAISEVYEKIDGILKKFLDNIPEDTAVLLVSDHGFGGISNSAVSINKWLQQESLLAFKDRSSLVDRGMGILKQAGLKLLPHGIQEKIFRSPLKGLAQRIEASSRFAEIHWHTTTAFSEELNYFPSIYLNVAGREPQGTVSHGKMYENVREKIIEKILEWKDPETGTSIVRSAWKREDLYSGPYVDSAPDIILDLNTINGYSYLCLPYTYFPSDEPFKKLEKDEQCGPRLLSMSGSHRENGIFLFSSDDLKETGRFSENINIQDICPSILSFFNIQLDAEMDGRVFGPFKNMITRTARPIP